jgi:hypothetical protein
MSDGNGQACAERNSAGNRSYRAAVVWMARFRRGIASNLFALGADDKIVQRVLRHAKPHVTRERYIKVFEPAVLAAMQKMQASLEELRSGQ